MRFCQQCGAQNPDMAKFCGVCGAEFPIDGSWVQIPTQFQQSQFPVSSPYSDQTSQKPKKKMSTFTACIWIVICLACIFSATISIFNKPKSSTSTSEVNASQTKEIIPVSSSTPEIEKSIKVIMDNTGLSESDAMLAFETIKSVGFENVGKMTLSRETENVKAYMGSLNCNGIITETCIENILITIAENKIYSISSEDIIFYDMSKGGKIDDVANYKLDQLEISLYQQTTIEKVKSGLKAPSTAQFPGIFLNADKWFVSRNHDIVTVQSYVDSQNSFGAMIRSNFKAQYSYEKKKLLYLDIDGNVVFGSLQ